MRVPLPSVLYVASAAMIAGSAWLVYDSHGLWSAQTAQEATTRGRDDAVKITARGKGKVRMNGDWDYGASAWWQQFKGLNLIGFVPKVKVPGDDDDIVTPPVAVATPLEDIFELVICFHGSTGEEGAQAHVVIRYKDEAQVQPPEWWIEENTAVARAGRPGRSLMAQPTDRVASRLTGSSRTGSSRTGTQQPSALPTNSFAGREVLQNLLVDAKGDVRRASNLWGKYSHIRLVRVDPSGESAWFVRDVPQQEGEPKVEPKEEEILKTSAGISQKLARALRQLQSRGGIAPSVAISDSTTRDWLDVDTTTRIGNEFHIGREDERMFEDPKALFASLHLDTFVSKYSDTRGLVVRNIKPEMAQKFGIATDDVLIAINGKLVSSKAQAANLAKRSYQRGVRTFTTTWWSNGQEITRVYRAREQR